MKYLLTGATGFIGERVARQLAEAGHQVVAVARTPSKAQDLADLGIAIHKGDVTDKESMRVPMTGEVAWLTREGRKPYWRGTITS